MFVICYNNIRKGGVIMPKLKDITGQKFGRLTALYRLRNYHDTHTYWLCMCECGNFKEVYLGSLTSGATTSCGCLVKKHGRSYEPIYRTWLGVKTRCYNKSDEHYNDYGGRGIEMCDMWLNNFMNFYDWAMNNGYKKGLTLDRVDVNGNYEPSNCRWATAKQQARNRRNNRHFTHNGKTYCIAEWCEILNLNYSTVCTRLNKLGWTIERALELEGK